jgi:hypothetical protein
MSPIEFTKNVWNENAWRESGLNINAMSMTVLPANKRHMIELTINHMNPIELTKNSRKENGRNMSGRSGPDIAENDCRTITMA